MLRGLFTCQFRGFEGRGKKRTVDDHQGIVGDYLLELGGGT